MSEPHAVSESSDPSPLPKINLDELSESERWWRDHQVWLAKRGYMLRPRYRPGWTPSWKAHPGKLTLLFEDWQPVVHPRIMDAVRISDDRQVVLKLVKKSWYPYELEITQFLADATRANPRNHTVPLLDVFEVHDDSDCTLIVMPLLRRCDSPRWQTAGEVVSFLTQVFEGMKFMHELHIAHRDCQALNIMYDPSPMYPDMFHPQVQYRSRDWKGDAKHSTRTARPVRYHYIDFGLSRKYNLEDGPPRELPIRGGDKTVPEFQNWAGEPLDPFPTDIYYLGNMIRTHVLEKYINMEFLAPLVDEMTCNDPSKRPSIQEVVERFEQLVKAVAPRRLRSRLIPRDEDPGETFFRNVAHAFRTARYILTRKFAIPIPS